MDKSKILQIFMNNVRNKKTPLCINIYCNECIFDTDNAHCRLIKLNREEKEKLVKQTYFNFIFDKELEELLKEGL